MMQGIPSSHQDLMADENRAYAYLSTVMKNGSPQVTPVWFNMDGDHILINSKEGRVKDINMKARPKVGILIMQPQDQMKYLSIQGTVVEIIEEGAVKHIEDLGIKYENTKFRVPADTVRLIYKIRLDNTYAG
ncbi:MAG: pyridoxamine 5'-phosphate oxidase family protein [Chloroflexota bacterium]